MKHLVKISAISALLLTINGCVTVETSHDTPLIAELGEVIIVDSYEELDMSTYGDETYKVEAMSTTSGEKFFYRHWAGYYKQAIGSLRNRALLACRDVFNSDCVITRAELATAYGNTTTYDEDIFYTSLEDYKNKQETRLVREREIEETRLVREREIEEKRRFNIEQHNIRQAKYQREEKERMIAELRDRCASYGFSGDENIAACVQREAQHDLELAQQERALRLAQQRLDNPSRQTQVQQMTDYDYDKCVDQARQEPRGKKWDDAIRNCYQSYFGNQSRQAQVQTQIVEEEVPWWLQFLADVAEGVAEGYAHDAIYHNDKPKVIYRNCDVYQC